MPGGARISAWDLYRRIPTDLTQATTQGGLVSISCIFTMALLFTMELWHYLSPPIVSDLTLDTNTEPQIRINFNITALDMPCRWVALDIKDRLGVNRVDVVQNIKKFTLTEKDKETYIDQTRKHNHATGGSWENMKAAMAEEGDSPTLIPANFDKVLSENQYVFVNFFAPWCSWCQRLAPTWQDFAQKMHQRHYHTAVRKVNCVGTPMLCSTVHAFPTLRIYKLGKPIADFNGERTTERLIDWAAAVTGEDGVDHLDEPEIKGENKDHLGCQVAGYIMVNRVPGNFHLIAKSDEHSFNPKETNLSHWVHHLSFGDPVPDSVMRQLPSHYQERMHPLNGRMYISQDPHITFEHYIKVLTTEYKLGWVPVLGYQMQFSSHHYRVDSQRSPEDEREGIPEARFAFEQSPTAVTVRYGGRAWYEFITNLCAIVGGVFTVMGLLDRSIHGMRSKLFKENVGKLG